MIDTIRYYSVYIKRIFEHKLYQLKKGKYPFPTMIQIQTINSCNARCLMCPNSKKNNEKIERMPDHLFNKIIDEIIRKTKSCFIYLTLQNEPLMDNKIFEKIKTIKEKGKKKVFVGIASNGSLITDKKIKELEESKLDSFIVSLDAASEETYKKIRHGLDFHKALKNIDKVINSNYNNYFAVGFVVQKDNIAEYKKFKKIWKKKGLSLHIINLSNRTGELDNYEDIMLEYKKYLLLDKVKYILSKKLIRSCPMPFTNFNILSNGDVILCCNDFNKKEILGNVNNSSIEEIWNSAKYHKIRKLMYNREFDKISACNDCSFHKKR